MEDSLRAFADSGLALVDSLCKLVTIQDKKRTHIVGQRHCKEVRDEVDIVEVQAAKENLTRAYSL